MSSRLPGKLLKEVKNGVVSSGITMEEEDSVPKSGLMPVKQYLIHQAKLSQSAPPVQPYRKSSSGLSQPKKVTFGSATFMSSRLSGKLLKEVKNGVVSSGITMEEEDSVPKSGLMPVKQYLIHQAKLSQSAPPVQPYRKSSSGLSQGSRESNSGYQGSPWCSSA